MPLHKCKKRNRAASCLQCATAAQSILAPTVECRSRGGKRRRDTHEEAVAVIYGFERKEKSFSPDIKLKALEFPADCLTAGALPPSSMLRHEDFNAIRAESTNALRTGI
jgi:hypothetical protein